MSHIIIDARESGTSTGRYIDKLTEYLSKLDTKHKITILTKSHRINYFEELTPQFEIIESKYKEFSFGEQFGLMRQIKGLKPDLVHFGMVQQPIMYKGKVVTTMHDLTTTRFKNPSKNKILFTFKQIIYKWVNRVAALKSNAIITPTEFVKDDVAKFAKINSRKIRVTYESSDYITDEPQPVSELTNKQFIMYVGRSQPHKNLYRLVTAFASLSTKYPNLKLVLAGKKDATYTSLESWINEQGIKNVVFTDFVTEGELRWLYENTKAYIFPSLSEGFGLPGLEAMRHGAPVISSDTTCLPEVYGNAALYFNPTDTDEIASKIKEVISNKKLREDLIKKGRAQAKKYSWEKMAAETIEIYEEVLINSRLSRQV